VLSLRPWAGVFLALLFACLSGAIAQEPDPLADPVQKPLIRSEVLSEPKPSAAKPLPSGTTHEDASQYSPQATALLLNYCRESLYKIIEFNDRTILDEEYGKLVNNIDITRIRDDEAAELIELLLKELSTQRLKEGEKQFLIEAYNRRVQAGITAAFKGLSHFEPVKVPKMAPNSPAILACQAIVAAASGISSFRSAVAKEEKEARIGLMQLEIEELGRLTEFRTRFFDTEYKLYKRYNLPDRLNLKEVQMAQYIKVLADEDPRRRLERLERLKDDFDAFPPFWYQIGKAAQEAGDTLSAKSYYAHFEQIQPRVFREDLDYVMLCMHRVLMYDLERDVEAIRHDLRIIEENTKYYYKWENILFAALMYNQINDLENARRLIRTSINEGYCVPLHEDILTQIESDAAKAQLAETQQDILEKADAAALEALDRVGPAQSLEALRALGKAITGITITVSERSRAGQNATYLIPGYNVYALGRAAVKGDAYFDNCIVHMPSTWFASGRPKLRLRAKGQSFKPSGISRDPKNELIHVAFRRVLKQSDIVEKKQECDATLRIETDTVSLDIDFQVQPVTPELQKLRPELSPDAPYFEMKSVTYRDRTYSVKDGVISYSEVQTPRF